MELMLFSNHSTNKMFLIKILDSAKAKKPKFRMLFLSLALIGVSCFSAQLYAQKESTISVKIALESYSFSKQLNNKIKGRGKGISLTDFLNISAENNFDAVSLTGYFFSSYPEVPKDEEINDLKRSAYELGLNIISLGVRNDFADPDPTKRAADVKHVKEWIDVAVRLGVPVVRVFSGTMKEGFESKRGEISKYMAASMRECADYAEKKGVYIGVQNHGDFLYTADQTIDLVKRVDSKSFGVVVDTGYFLTSDPYADIAKVMPYALNFLLKESYTINDVTTKIDLQKIAKILKANHFRGNVALETLAPKKSSKSETQKKEGTKDYDPYTEVPEFYKAVKVAINQ